MTPFEERLQRISEEATRELNHIGIYPSNQIICFKENRRAKKRLGCCKKEKSLMQEKFIIEVALVMQTETDEKIKEILIHELLHTCKGCFNHGPAWKALAQKVNQAYGYKISTYVDTRQLNIDKPAPPKYKYKITCSSCKTAFYRQKRSKLIEKPQRYRCGKCGGRLIVREI